MELKNKKIIEKMTLKEKALLLSGKGMWKTYGFEKYGIPEFFLSDGPHGMRTQAVSYTHLTLPTNSRV